MAHVVFLRGVNVGGHRSLRPSRLVEQLRPLDVVSIGAAGTFVVRGQIRRAELRAAITRHLPFEADVMICTRGDVLRLVSLDPFAGDRVNKTIVRFASIMRDRPRRRLTLPASVPEYGRWSVRVLGRSGPFLYGVHRREMKAIRYLGELDELSGGSLATRSWSTILSVARRLETDEEEEDARWM